MGKTKNQKKVEVAISFHHLLTDKAAGALNDLLPHLQRSLAYLRALIKCQIGVITGSLKHVSAFLSIPNLIEPTRGF
jgi:hypothetical protein